MGDRKQFSGENMTKPRKNLIGLRYGKLTVIKQVEDFIEKSGKPRVCWDCLCDCGKHRNVTTHNLQRKKVHSCGCDYPFQRHPSDLTDLQFGKLVVIRPALSEEIPPQKDGARNRKWWFCQCDCGNTVVARATALNGGKIKSCGCLFYDIYEDRAKSAIGKKFGKLTVVDYLPVPGKTTLLKCKCDCGNITYAPKSQLEGGYRVSCGCRNAEHMRELGEKRRLDLTGQRFGRLTVIEYIPSSSGCPGKWKCVCDCGSTAYATTQGLKSGSTSSCGCLLSKGEEKIAAILEQAGIKFKKNTTFPDLLSDKRHRLRFDFGVYDDSEKLQYLIEYDGSQHYTPRFWPSQEEYEAAVKRDLQKDIYCQERAIPLIRIPYFHFDSLCLQDILLESTGFLVSREEVVDIA